MHLCVFYVGLSYFMCCHLASFINDDDNSCSPWKKQEKNVVGYVPASAPIRVGSVSATSWKYAAINPSDPFCQTSISWFGPSKTIPVRFISFAPPLFLTSLDCSDLYYALTFVHTSLCLLLLLCLSVCLSVCNATDGKEVYWVFHGRTR